MAVFSSIAELASFVAAGPRLIGIVGAPGAGKSTIAAALVSAVCEAAPTPGGSAALLPMDGFHLPQAELVRLGRRERMGAPDTFDVDGFVAVLEALNAQEARREASRESLAPSGASAAAHPARIVGDSVIAPAFNREIEEPVPGAILISPSVRTVVVEGNYLLLGSGGWERVSALLGATVCVEVDADIRRARLIERHIRYGKSPEDARAWALGPDEANALLIEATAARADHRIALA